MSQIQPVSVSIFWHKFQQLYELSVAIKILRNKNKQNPSPFLENSSQYACMHMCVCVSKTETKGERKCV